MNELIPIDITPVKLFQDKGLDPILNEIKKKVDEFEADIETAGGRKAVASFAHKIAKSKTFIEKMGKELVSKQKAAIKLIDIERKRSRDFLDEQRDRARLPLTEWEEAEKIRIEAEMFEKEFNAAFDEALTEDALFNREREIQRKEAEAVRIEEEKRAKEEAARIKKEREEREELLKKEAAEAAKKEAEEALAAEKEKAIRLEAEAKAEKERAEQARKDAIEKAEIEKKEAIKRARREVEERILREKQETERKAAEEKRVADKKAAHKSHQRKINREILEGFKSIGITEGKLIVEAILKKQIPHIEIKY